jgi:sodium-coupled neutral amino acid transporter 11
MPGQGGRRNGRVDEEDSRPLLVSSREDLSLRSTSTENILFAIEGDEDEPETSALEDTDTHRRSKADQTVRFQEHVQVIALPLRSTLESREAGM